MRQPGLDSSPQEDQGQSWNWYEFTGDSGACDWWTFLSPEIAPDICQRWAQSVRTGDALEMEMSLRGRDGQYRPFLTRAVPVRDEAGLINRWIGTHIDLSVSGWL
jgi:PAS domain-containing protein